MIWKVVRAQVWTLQRKLRASNKLVVIGVAALLIFAGRWAVDQLWQSSLAGLTPEQAAPMIAPMLPFAIFIFLLFALLSIGDIIYQLYLAPDLELLMVAPISTRVVFVVKLLQACRAALIPALLFMFVLMLMGLAWEMGISYYLLILLFVPAEVLLVTALIMSLVSLMSRLIPPQKVRSRVPTAVTLMALALAMAQGPASQWLLGQTRLMSLMTASLMDTGQLAKLVAGLAALASISSLAAYQIFRYSFYEGWNRFQVVPFEKTAGASSRVGHSGLSRLLRPLPSPVRFILAKEWLSLRRDPQGLLSFSLPLVYLVMIVGPFWRIEPGHYKWQPFLFWYMLIFSSFILVTLPLGAPLLSIVKEGRNIDLLRSTPVSMRAVLKGKFWATVSPLFLLWGSVIPIVGIWQQFPPWQIGVQLGVAIWGLTVASLANIALGGLKADFEVEQLKQRIPRVASYLMLGFNTVFFSLIVATATWLMVQLYPQSDIILLIKALAEYRPLAWIFSEVLWPPLLLVGGQVALLVAVKTVWTAAISRLENWEIMASSRESMLGNLVSLKEGL